jgi:hypothetical protein
MSDELRYFLLRSGCDVPSSDELSTHTSRLILVALADHADYEHKLYVSYRGLARELALSPSTTFTAYKLYETHGALRRTGKRRGIGGSTEYRLCLDFLTAANPTYYLPSAFSTPASSTLASGSVTASVVASASASASDSASDLSTQARNRSLSISTSSLESSASAPSSHVEALLWQSVQLELKYVPSTKSIGMLIACKTQKYLPVCRQVLERYPLAQPATHADLDLALAVCEITNPHVSALKLSAAGKRELERRYCRTA